MNRLPRITVFFAAVLLVGCSESEDSVPEMPRIEYPVLTRDLASDHMDRRGERTFRCVLGKVKEGLVGGSYALFPGKGVNTTGYLLDQFDASEYEEQFSNLKAGQSIWVVIKGQCKPYSAPYPIYPPRDPEGVFYNYTILSTTVDSTPLWTGYPDYPEK